MKHTASIGRIASPTMVLVNALIELPTASLSMLTNMMERQRQRYHLADLEPRMLRDVGLTEGMAGRETRKPFWKD